MDSCAFEQIVELVGDRWSLLLVSALLGGPRRTTELAGILAPISTRTLAERLKRLDAAGLLVRRAYPEAPPRVEYQLTAKGEQLREVLSALRRTAAQWEDFSCPSTACRVCDLDVGTEMRKAQQPGEGVTQRAAVGVDVTLL